MQFNYLTKESEKRPIARVGDTVSLQKGDPFEVVECQETHVPMLNIDADQIEKGDLLYIKKLGLTISNPDTDKPVAIGVDYVDNSFGHRIKKYFESDSKDDDDDDDSSFFAPVVAGGVLGGLFGGSPSFGGFGGSPSFGGFGGGSFSGGGASRSF